MAQLPVLLVHGIWDTAARIEPLARGLRARGIERVTSFTLVPNTGRAPLAQLAEQVAQQVEALAAQYGSAQIDLVGFSMGALTARYYLQRGGGKARVRRFVSLSGPHAGTWSAYALPFAGVRDMRPGSALLRDLALDLALHDNPWDNVEVHCLYTPYDLMIVPPESAVLPAARSVQAFPVVMHRFMLSNTQVLDRVAALLG